MRYKELLIHIICWIAFSTFIFYWQSNVFTFDGALLHTLRTLGFGMVIFYSNLYILLPLFFEKTHYLKYALFTLLVIIATSLVFEVTQSYMPRPDFRGIRIQRNPDTNPDMPNISPEQRKDTPSPDKPFRRPGQRAFMGLFMFSTLNTIPMLFFSTILWLTIENRKKRQQEITLKNESLKSEMRFLKSQINPHFLFNALNNIYSLSYTKSEIAPQMIMKLSDMLRHVVYDSSNMVKLEKEVLYINNYIDFQKLKIGTEVNISFDYEAAIMNFMIEPMLLTPFVENAFKHSDIESNPNGYIDITLKTEGKQLLFEVKNSYSKEAEQSVKDSTPGIGIQNVTKRLELAYQERSNLETNHTGDTFTIKLQLTSK